MSRSEKDKARDERILATAKRIGENINKPIPMTPDVLSDAELDELIGAPMTLQQHRAFYRMYLCVLGRCWADLPRTSESTVEALNDAYRHCKDPRGLGALIELCEELVHRQVLPFVVEADRGAQMAAGRRKVENPVIEAMAQYLRDNPKATYKELWRDANKWLPDGADVDGDTLFFTDAKGREKTAGFGTFKDWVTAARKKFSPDS